MIKYVLGALITTLILYSVYLIFRSELNPANVEREIVTGRAQKPASVNINLDAGFNNFRNHTGLSLDVLPCELYDQKLKHVTPLQKLNLGNYDDTTSQLLVSLIKQINKVKNQKNLLESTVNFKIDLKFSKLQKIDLDTTKLQKLYNNLMKRKDIIDTKEQEIKLLRDNFKPSVVSGRQWEIDVEKQLISYLTKRLDYLRSLKPKTHDNAEDNWNKIGKTLDTTENTLHAIVSDYDQSKNVIKYDDEIQKLLNLKKYWQLRLVEIRSCQKTDKGYRQDQGHDIYRQLQSLRRAQKNHQNDDYCMQLRKHLVLKLIKQFDVIQSDFNCIKQKPRAQAQILKLNNQIQNLRNKNRNNPALDPHRHDDNFEKLKKNYNDINNEYQRGVKRIQVGYDPETLKDILKNTQSQLQKHQNRLNDLQSGKGDDYGDDPNKIVKLVNQNIELKGDYCKDYEEYERQNQNLRNKLDKISADRSVQHVGLERYLTLSKEIKQSLYEISNIKQRLIGRLGV